MSQAVVNSETTLQTLIGDLREQFREHKYLKVSVKSGKDRSINQNDHSHTWYEQIARELREDTALGVKSFCKLHFGVPILRAESDDFRQAYDSTVKTMTYEQKLEVMKILPVTSLMTKKQIQQYLDAMQASYVGRVELKYPEKAV